MTRTPRKYSGLLCSGREAAHAPAHYLDSYLTETPAAAAAVSCDTAQTAGPGCGAARCALLVDATPRRAVPVKSVHSHLVPFDEFAPLTERRVDGHRFELQRVDSRLGPSHGEGLPGANS